MNHKIGKKKRRLRVESSLSANEPATPMREQPHEEDAGEWPNRAHTSKMYKYASSQFINNIFNLPKQVTLKCSLPKDFNDPYELFLTIDFNEEPDALAFYADAVGDLAQLPTTCFSRSPDVIPMWAHYAENHKGFVLEFSESRLAEAFPESSFQDVAYTDAPPEDLTDMLYRAFRIGKYRYTYFLRQGVYHAAYFTKATCWGYEQERRMVATETEIRKASGLLLLDAPVKSVSSIIVGSRATDETKEDLLKKSQEIGCNYFEIRIGKSSAKPYFVDPAGQPYVFDDQELRPCDSACEECLEPLPAKSSQMRCSWCRIDDQLRQYAASRNSYRMLDRAGLLESYIKGMDEITFGKRKPGE
jgi:Protein of unknown function (DUF2971)